MGADVRLHELCQYHGHRYMPIPGHPPGCKMCCVCAYQEDRLCSVASSLCKCTPQITYAEVKRLLHFPHMELRMVHPDSYPADPSSPDPPDASDPSDASGASDADLSSADLFSWQLPHDGWA